MPKLTRGGITEPVTQHLMRILNRLSGNYIVIMAYREYAFGTNGTIKLSETEMAFAETKTPNVHIYIGQETTKVDPEHITFYEEGMAVLKTEMQKINTTFSPRSPYVGIALHHIDSLRVLKP
jgi:hypothetical protein